MINIFTESLPVSLLLFKFCYSASLSYLDIAEEKGKFLNFTSLLYEDLFKDYEPNVAAIYTKRAVNETDNDYANLEKDQMFIALVNAKIVEVNPMKQLMTIIFHYTIYWYDARLTWDPNYYDNITNFYAPRKKIWIPDVTAFDSSVVIDTRTKQNQWVKVTYSGLCLFPQAIVTSFNCPMNVDNFPFDTHNCSLRLLSYTLNLSEVNLTSEISPYNTVQRVGNEEWEVLNISFASGIIFPDAAATQQNEFTFTVRRNPSFYVSLIILPSFFLTTICIAGFFTSNLIVDDREKVEMGLTTIMSMTVMISLVSESIPKTEKTPKLTEFIMWNLLILLLSTIVVICLPKIWQFISLMFTSCKHVKKGWFRRNFWFFRALMTIFFLLIFEWFAFKNFSDFLGTKQYVIVFLLSGTNGIENL